MAFKEARWVIAALQTLDHLSQRDLGLDIVDRLAEGLLYCRRIRVDEGRFAGEGWPLFSIGALGPTFFGAGASSLMICPKPMA
ncbi:hypothetical protein RGR602_CH01675 [Rhizobium gallicum bv. gallicum R602sp]|uniref:Uncharacterized protein n=1 Tax=Rhizobium gallicum bv. gallicum R602sp TaxID=1041138 RepID=A0A0B4WZE0_9HYPH|nr:hypothetical protein RGR602_CH01675 [Rhizobium gallicum bv. gallicum R602sp]